MSRLSPSPASLKFTASLPWLSGPLALVLTKWGLAAKANDAVMLAMTSTDSRAIQRRRMRHTLSLHRDGRRNGCVPTCGSGVNGAGLQGHVPLTPARVSPRGQRVVQRPYSIDAPFLT